MEKKNFKMLQSVIQLKDCINNILKSCSLKAGVKNVCESYLKRMDNGEPEEMIYESFINDMTKFSSINSIEGELNLLQYRAKSNKNNLDIKKCIYEMRQTDDNVIASMIESNVVNYLVNKDDESAKALKESLQIFNGRPMVDKLVECLTLDEYSKKISGKTTKMALNEDAITAEVLYTKEQMDDIVKQKVDEALKTEKEKNAPKGRKMSDLEDRIQLQASIDNILAKEGRNKNVKAFCESYLDSLRSGKSQYSLYESFISGLSQYNYLNAVDTELSAMKDRVSKYKQDIDLTKILEMMSQTDSYYIVPIIEECVVNYCENKNATSRMMARQALDPFMYDPFVKDMMLIIGKDKSIENLYLGESVETQKLSHTENIYSPVLYIKENETVFNVDGVYYDKKGANMTRVPKSDVYKLNESFRRTANAINSRNTEYDEVNDRFKIYSKNGKDVALVSESQILVNGKEIKIEDICNENFQMIASYNGNSEFYRDIRAIYENYGTIAPVDFAKRVKSNDSNKCVDIFKINKTIHMALVNEDNTTEFYKNVNPIKCKNLMNEHMNFNVDAMFEEMMPNQKKLQEDINDTKDAYENYIATLENKRKQLDSLKEEDDDVDKESIEKAQKLIDDELAAAKKDYEKYQKDSEEELNKPGSKSDDKDSKDDDSDDVKGVEADMKSEVSEPISDTEDNVIENPETNGDEEVANAEDSDNMGDDMFNGIEDYSDNATEYDGLFDTTAPDDELEKGFDIVKVSFDKNIKTGKTSNKGTVIMTVPMVNGNGDVKDEIKMITFSVGQDKSPIINNDYMSAVMYNAIKSAIESCEDINNIDSGSYSDGTDVDTSSTISQTDTTMTDEPASDTVVATGTIEKPITNTSDTQDVKTDDYKELGADSYSPEDINEPIKTSNDDIESHLTDDDFDDYDDLGVERESPAEVETVDFRRSEDEGYINVSFPIEVGLAYKEITPIDPKEFMQALHNAKIEVKPAKDEKLGDGIIIVLNNRAQIEFVMKYFKHWLDIDRHAFFAAFPELRQFESFNYVKADKLYESVINEGTIEINVENVDDDFIDALDDEDIKYDNSDDEGVVLVANNVNEFDEVVKFISDYSRTTDNDDLKKELTNIVGDVDVDTFQVILEYDGKLASVLDKEGIDYDEDDENLVILVSNPDEAEVVISTADDLGLESPSLDELKEMIDNGGFVNEGMKITVEDTENHKKVTFDTDDLDSSEEDEQDKKEEDSDGDASFKDDTQLYDTSTGEGEKTDDTNNNSAGDNGQQGGNTQESSTPKKKKFVFKAKKMHESASVRMAEPHVGDKVKYKGQVGFITSKMSDDKFVVIVKGSTIVCDKSEVKLMTPKVDLVDDPNDKIITKL